jgi:F0F1-type ATP synthase assembly protein I
VKQKKNFFELFTELIGWLSIAISPFVIGSFIGLIIYSYKTDKTSLLIAILIACLGLVAGVIWATRIWRKRGTISFLSKLNSSERIQTEEEPEQ